ncbi:hypothetical protein ACFQ4N_09825 [Oceanobacillus iheyensis]|uniref:Uncharacterized protein n=1 Tax=Oceanobacillus iheyensis (strain DSM 14371 / CIP 107618 / JCM 11309 / KCTC 3954 / HTE831) TaxID=221109 RepID=Q8ERL2_OCEIH|nr:hypothetical protein [Oceanobacillus iheyensis]BAC13246.1 hypothetical protein [Oceanobacillus iheyensis HTE831]
MSELHSITVTENILSNEDFSYKKDTLRKHVNNIQEQDDQFYKLIEDVIVGEDQKGKIVDSLQSESRLLQLHDVSIGLTLNYKINRVVTNFNEQVEDMKEQRLTITYENTPST